MSSFIYNIVVKVYYLYPWEQRRITITFFVDHIFSAPYFIDFIVIITTIFYLNNLECRFKLLNDIWDCLLPTSVTVHDRMIQSERIVLIEKIRLLHFELSELIRIFNFGYGKLILGCFSMMFIEMFAGYFYIICFIDSVPNKFLNENNIKYVPYIISIQSKMFLMYIIIAASRVSKEVILTHKFN